MIPDGAKLKTKRSLLMPHKKKGFVAKQKPLRIPKGTTPPFIPIPKKKKKKR